MVTPARRTKSTLKEQAQRRWPRYCRVTFVLPRPLVEGVMLYRGVVMRYTAWEGAVEVLVLNEDGQDVFQPYFMMLTPDCWEPYQLHREPLGMMLRKGV